VTPDEFRAWQESRTNKKTTQINQHQTDSESIFLTEKQFGEFLFIMSYMQVWPHEGFLLLSKFLRKERFKGYTIIPNTRFEKRFEIMGRFCEAVELWLQAQSFETRQEMAERLMTIPQMAEFMATELGVLAGKVRSGEL
jgi:hypothetical protein